jgi:mannose-1-phosphate guanylyltransferase
VGGVKILPVIMCGGSGTRMWPESRESLPKQFIPLIGQRSTFQTIVSVVSDPRRVRSGGGHHQLRISFSGC